MPKADSGVDFRRLALSDLPRLVGWFAQPEIARWWNQPATLDAVAAKYGPRVSNREATRMWIAVIETVPSGLLQSYRHADYPNHETAAGVPDAVGIDYPRRRSPWTRSRRTHAGRVCGPRLLRVSRCRELCRNPGPDERAVVARFGACGVRATRDVRSARRASCIRLCAHAARVTDRTADRAASGDERADSRERCPACRENFERDAKGPPPCPASTALCSPLEPLGALLLRDRLLDQWVLPAPH